MFKGVTDELAIGFNYPKIDLGLYILEHDLNEEIAQAEGITSKELERIRALNRYSAGKRRRRHEFPSLFFLQKEIKVSAF
jgi:NH3-dependent NAD+ synthetase